MECAYILRMRKVYHWDREKRQLVDGPAPVHVVNRAPSVWKFTPFVSQATGRIINDNGQLRDDLAASGCRVKEPEERLNMPPVNPSHRHLPGYDPDFAKEWYRKRAEAARPEPESPAVQALIDSRPDLKELAHDRSRLHADPYRDDPT